MTVNGRRWPVEVVEHALNAGHLWRWNGYAIEHCPDLLAEKKALWRANPDESVLAVAELEIRPDTVLIDKADLWILMTTSLAPAWQRIENLWRDGTRDEKRQIASLLSLAHPALLRRLLELMRQERFWESDWLFARIAYSSLGAITPARREASMEPLAAEVAKVLDGGPISPGFLTVAAFGIGVHAALPVALNWLDSKRHKGALEAVEFLRHLATPAALGIIEEKADHSDLRVALLAGSVFVAKNATSGKFFDRLIRTIERVPLNGGVNSGRPSPWDTDWNSIARQAGQACLLNLGGRSVSQIRPIASRWPHLLPHIEDRFDTETRDGTLDEGGRAILLEALGGEPWLRRWAFQWLSRLDLSTGERKAVTALAARRSPELRLMCKALLK